MLNFAKVGGAAVPSALAVPGPLDLAHHGSAPGPGSSDLGSVQFGSRLGLARESVWQFYLTPGVIVEVRLGSA